MIESVPYSTVKGISWPALSHPDGTAVMSLLHQLEHSQWWPAEKLLTQQMQQASHVFHFAQQTTEFYPTHFKDLNYSAEAGLLNYEQWLGIPLLSRENIQQHADSLKSKNYLQEHGETFTSSTSGSTGKPVTTTRTQINDLFWRTITLRDHLWHQRDFSKIHAAIRFVDDLQVAKAPDGATSPTWGPAVDRVYPCADSHLLRIDTPIKDQLDWLNRISPSYLLSYPSNLGAMVEYAQTKNIQLPHIEEVRTVSEALDATTRQIIEDGFQTAVTDVYSCQEIGNLALQCPQTGNYHIQSETVLIEVLNDNGQPCNAGETGKVIITDLHNFAMPIIRYDIGDYAEVAAPCTCGRGLPTIKRFIGRVRNMMVTGDGDKLWPRLRNQFYSEVSGINIRQCQVIQHKINELEVRLVADEIMNEVQTKKLTEYITEALGEDNQIKFTYHDKIMRSANGKFEEFISLIT